MIFQYVCGFLVVIVIILVAKCFGSAREKQDYKTYIEESKKELKCANDEIHDLELSYQKLDKKFKDEAKKPAPTLEAEQLMSNLLGSGAVIVTKIIDPSSVFLWGQKDT